MADRHGTWTDILQQEGIEVLAAGPIEGANDLDLGQVVVGGNDALRAWRALRGSIAQTGRWPVVLGGEPALEYLQDQMQSCLNAEEPAEKSRTLGSIVAEWLAQAEALPFDQWLTNHRDPVWLAADQLRQAEAMDAIPGGQSMAQLYRKFAADYATFKPEAFDPAKIEWPSEEVEPVTGLSVLTDLSTLDFEETPEGPVQRGPFMYERAVIALLPTIKGWEAPAYLFFGGFNACPFPDVHVAMAKWGSERHTAEIVAISSDTIDLQCHRPPATREDAIWLARDLQLYAEEVSVTTKGPARLASALKNGSIWSCWWD